MDEYICILYTNKHYLLEYKSIIVFFLNRFEWKIHISTFFPIVITS